MLQFCFTSLHLNSLNSTLTVTTLLQGDLYSMRCLDVLSSVPGWFTLPLLKAGQLVQHWVASSYFWASLGRCWLISCEGDQKGA